ncbi:MAG: carotenoid oxygenase family protein [Dermatophilaceae bacterium]
MGIERGRGHTDIAGDHPGLQTGDALLGEPLAPLVPNEGSPALQRWVVDLAGGRVTQEPLDDRAVEFPRIDERRTGRRHRFGYAVAYDDDGYPTGTLVKHDLVAGSTLTHDRARGEPG